MSSFHEKNHALQEQKIMDENNAFCAEYNAQMKIIKSLKCNTGGHVKGPTLLLTPFTY